MIDPQARPAAYIKLMALVAVLGVISALVTFAFMALVHQGTMLLWEQAALALGVDPRLFTLLVCTIGGLLVGLLVKLLWRPQRHLCRSDARIWQDRALRLSQRARHRDHGLCVAHLRRQPRPRSAAGGCLRRHRHVGLRPAQARRAGNAHDGLFRRQRDAGRLHHLAVRRGAAGPGIGARRTRRQDRRISGCCFPACWPRPWPRWSLSCSAGAFFETLYKFPDYTPRLVDLFYAVPLGLIGGVVGVLFMLSLKRLQQLFQPHEGARGAARAARRSGHGDHRRAPAADAVLGRGTDDST